MYYFLKKENFNLDKYDFDVNITPRLTKRELDILAIFLEKFKVEENYTEVEFDSKLFKEDKEKLKKTINNINKKAISIYIYEDGAELTSIYFNIFDIVVFEGNKIIYKLSEELRLSYDLGNFFSRIRILTIIQFKSTYSYRFFKLISRTLSPKKEWILKFSMDELRDKLGLEDGIYTRFYDFENKVLKPVIKDVESFSPHIYYKKIYSKKGKGSKIIGVELHIINAYHMVVNSDTNMLIKEFNDYIDDFAIAYNNIYSYRKLHDLEDTRSYIKANLDNISKDL